MTKFVSITTESFLTLLFLEVLSLVLNRSSEYSPKSLQQIKESTAAVASHPWNMERDNVTESLFGNVKLFDVLWVTKILTKELSVHQTSHSCIHQKTSSSFWILLQSVPSDISTPVFRSWSRLLSNWHFFSRLSFDRIIVDLKHTQITFFINRSIWTS